MALFDHGAKVNYFYILGLSQFSEGSGCICLGRMMSYLCTVFGGTYSVWKGSVFDCSFRQDEILIRHSANTSNETCNDGGIIVNGIDDGISFTSRLTIMTVSDDMEGGTVECSVLNASGAETPIGRSVIRIPRGLSYIIVLYT